MLSGTSFTCTLRSHAALKQLLRVLQGTMVVNVACWRITTDPSAHRPLIRCLWEHTDRVAVARIIIMSGAATSPRRGTCIPILTSQLQLGTSAGTTGQPLPPTACSLCIHAVCDCARTNGSVSLPAVAALLSRWPPTCNPGGRPVSHLPCTRIDSNQIASALRILDAIPAPCMHARLILSTWNTRFALYLYHLPSTTFACAHTFAFAITTIHGKYTCVQHHTGIHGTASTDQLVLKP